MGNDVPPKKLYKYKSLSIDEEKYTKEIFMEQKLYAPGPKKFNDPFDCRIKLSTECSEDEFRNVYNNKNHPLKLQRRRYSGETDEQAIQRLYKQKDSFITEKGKNKFLKWVNKTGVICFSELPDQILMWAHYADKHHGICLQFDTEIGEDLFRILYEGKYNTRKVDYVDEPPVFRVFNPDFSEIAEQAVFRKATDWKYEEEWRIIKTKGAYSHNNKLPPGTLRGVILGAKISDEDEVKVREWCECINLSPKRIYKARLKKDKYGLEIPGLLRPVVN